MIALVTKKSDIQGMLLVSKKEKQKCKKRSMDMRTPLYKNSKRREMKEGALNAFSFPCVHPLIPKAMGHHLVVRH